MRILCVAEKPSIARSVTEILSGNQFTTRQSANRYTKNFDFHYRLPSSPQLVDFTVTSVLGHLTGTEFDSSFKQWHSCDPFSLFDAPINRFVNPDHKGIEKNLQAESRRADKLMIWTDCDREGEHIGFEIVSVCKKVKPSITILRARFSAIIPAQIHNACQNAGHLDMKQVYAVEARMELDLRIGAALTRTQTLGLQSRFHQLADSVISYGPCQFPTLGFVVDQYEKVKAFIPETFWYIHVLLERDVSKVEFKWKRHRLFDYHAAFVLHEMCTDEPEATVKDVNIKPAVKWKPLPLTTVELQKSGSRLLHLTPKVVLDIAEKLYQRGLVSYPRTETDQFDREFDFMSLIEKQMNDTQWGTFATKLKNEGGFQVPRNGKKNDKAHPPIHPTAHANNLNAEEKRVYDFITRRYLACCSKNATGKTTTVEISIADEEFTSTGLVIIERNYLEVYIYDKWNGNLLPDFQPGETFIPTMCSLKEGSTTRPSLLTEADLVGLMDRNGIGTDATIAEHIAKIVERNYVFKTREGSTDYLVPSTLGIGLVEGYNAIGLDKSLSKPQLRRETEHRMSLICEGARTKRDVLNQTIDEYRDVFIRTKRAFATIVEQVARYLNHSGDAGGQNPEDILNGIGTGNDGPGGGGGGRGGRGQNNRRRGEPGAQRARPGRGSRSNIPRHDTTRGNGGVSSSDHDDNLGPDGGANRGGNSRGRGIGASRGTGRANATTEAISSHRPTTVYNSAPMTKLEESSAPLCKCGSRVVERTVVKEGPNKGRQFYVCPKPSTEGSCGFQGWVEDGSNSNIKTGSGQNSQKRSAAELEVPSARRLKTESQNEKTYCNCDLEATYKMVVKEGPNKGRGFWMCSKVSKAVQCKFFKWDDEDTHNPVAGPSRAPGVLPTTDGNNCFECGKPGHWSGQCPNKSLGRNNGQGSNYTCFNCNEQGHLSTNCPKKVGGLEAGGQDSSGNKCYICGNSDHWANSCPSKGKGTAGGSFNTSTTRSRGTNRGTTAGRSRSRGTSRSSRATGKGKKRNKDFNPSDNEY